MELFVIGVVFALMIVWALNYWSVLKRVKFLEDQNGFFHNDVASIWRSHMEQSDELRRYIDNRFNELETDPLGRPTKIKK